MFELLSPTAKNVQDDPVTLREALGVYALLMTVVFVTVFAAVSLGDQPHGMQLAALIGYSGLVFTYMFFRTRGVPTRYSLAATYVQRQLPGLLLIHCAYLMMLYVVAGWTLERRPALPSFLLDVGFLLIGLTQVIVSRTILSRAKRGIMR